MMDRGYIRLFRKFQDHFLWKKNRVFSEAEAWIDMIFEARFKKDSQKVLVGNSVFEIGYGEVIRSNRDWAKRWRWSEAKVRRFLKLLESCSQIRRKTVAKVTHITIENYSKYHDWRRQDDAMMTQWRRNDDAMGHQNSPNSDNLTPPNPVKPVNPVKENIYADFSEKPESEKTTPEPNIKPDIPYQEIVSFLNEQLGTRYSPKSKKTVGLINARFSEGFTLDDFKAAIKFKCGEWLSDPKMSKFLTPDTLFSGKFEKYVNQAIQKKGKSQNDSNLPYHDEWSPPI